MTEDKTKDSAFMVKVVYFLYLATFLGGMSALAGVIIAYLFKADAPEYLQSHYKGQIRLFWIGLLLTILAYFLTLIGIGFILLFLILVWFMYQAVKGLKLVSDGKPLE